MSRLKLLLLWAGDQLYGLLISLGWQPREQQQQGDSQPPSST